MLHQDSTSAIVILSIVAVVSFFNLSSPTSFIGEADGIYFRRRQLRANDDVEHRSSIVVRESKAFSFQDQANAAIATNTKPYQVGQDFNIFWKCLTTERSSAECGLPQYQLQWNDTKGDSDMEMNDLCLRAMGQMYVEKITDPASVPQEDFYHCPWFDKDFGFRSTPWMPKASLISNEQLANKWKGKWIYFMGDSTLREYFYGFVVSLMSDPYNNIWETPFEQETIKPKYDFEGVCSGGAVGDRRHGHPLCHRDWIINGVRVTFTFADDERDEEWLQTTFENTVNVDTPPDAIIISQYSWFSKLN